MNYRYLLLPLLGCLLAASAVQAQSLLNPPRHNFSIGPIVGYDYDIKGLAYGAGLLYEFRPFEKVGFTAGFTYERTRKEFPQSSFGHEIWLHEVYALSMGARYYVGDFYLGAALGLGHDKGMFKQQDGTKRSGGSAYSLYKSIGAGYQIALRNRDVLEVEVGTFGTSNSMKIGGTARYKFRR